MFVGRRRHKMLTLSSELVGVVALNLSPQDLSSYARTCRTVHDALKAARLEELVRALLQARGVRVLPSIFSSWRKLWLLGVQHRHDHGAGSCRYKIEMKKTRDSGGEHEALLVAKGSICVGTDGSITGEWIEEEKDENGNGCVDQGDDKWIRYKERLNGSLCSMKDGWRLSLLSHYEGPRWEYYWDEYTLGLESAIDGYKMQFAGSYKGYGSAYDFAHGKDVSVVLRWCPPPERRSMRERAGRSQ